MGQAILSIVFLAFFIGLILFMIYDLIEVNVLKSIWKFMKRVSTPKTDIDKEIAEEEKEIAELERQKEKIETLEELKRRKERLFKDVHEVYEETSSEYWICPQCRRKFKNLEGLNNHRAWEHRP